MVVRAAHGRLQTASAASGQRNQVQTMLSSSRLAWSRSRRRRDRRPHGMLGIVLKIEIIVVMAKTSLGRML